VASVPAAARHQREVQGAARRELRVTPPRDIHVYARPRNEQHLKIPAGPVIAIDPAQGHTAVRNGGKPVNLISVNTYWTLWLLPHLLLAVALLGALTHQAVSVTMPVRKVAGPGGFVTRFRAVPAAGYAAAVCILWVLTFIVGSYIYTKYRIYVRVPLEQ